MDEFAGGKVNSVCVYSFIFTDFFKIVRPQGLSVQYQYFD